MSYVNFSITHRFDANSARMTERYDTGFSREGGRVEFATKTTSSDGSLPSITRSVSLDDAVTTAGRSVLDAMLAGALVQDMVVDHGDGVRPDVVSWTMRHGEGGIGLVGALPNGIQNVLDAADVFTKAVDAAPPLSSTRP